MSEPAVVQTTIAPQTPPPVAAAPAPADPPAPPAPVVAPAPAPSAPRVVGRGGDEVPEEAISDVKKKEREAERKRLLKAEFGTDDPAEIERIKSKRATDEAELARLRADEEKRKRSEMTEIDQLKADLAAANEKITTLTKELEEAKTATIAQKQSAEVRALITSHKFKDKYVPFVNDAMAVHFKSLTKTEQGKFGRAAINAWLAKYAKENPELLAAEPAPPPPAEAAAPEAAPAPPAAPKPPVRQPATNGKQPVPPKVATPPAAPDPLAGKTPRPGLPNSMNDKELKEYMARRGMKKTW